MKNLILFFLTLTLLFFSACSTKEVFEPKDVQGDWELYGDSDFEIKDISSDVALLDNHKVLTKSKTLDVKIAEGYRLIGQSDGWVISSSIDGKVNLQYESDANTTEILDLKKTVAAASVKDDILAVLFANNDMALYSISSKKLLFDIQGEAPVIVDARIVNPHFMNDLVLFLTLDGKVVIVNTTQKKKLRTSIVSSEQNFNNIIYFNVVDNKLIAATSTKVLSLAQKEIRSAYEIRNILYDEKNIYISTKQGEVLSLTPDLQVNAKLKFPFAHFLAMISNKDKLYLLEKEGYIIEITKDLLEFNVYEVDIEDGYIFSADKIFYVDDEYISVE